MELTEEELIFDWNRSTAPWPTTPPLLIEHTLPAAALTPSAHLPSGEGQVALISAVAALGLRCFALGSWTDHAVQELYRGLYPQIEDGSLRCWAEGSARSVPASRCQVYISQRQQGWTSLLKQLGSRATLVLQDVTRSHPDALVDQVRAAVESGAQAICLNDDAGRAIPAAAEKLVGFVRQVGQRLGGNFRIEWSGRNDRSGALYNALAAWRAGAGAIHCSFFGLGEGSGMVPTELLLANLVLLGAMRRDLRALKEVSRKVSDALGLEIHANQPVVGRNAFRTATGVHAAAIMKAEKKGHDWLADLIYSGVPASRFGFTQMIEIGPMAGTSNVHHWLRRHHMEAPAELVASILEYAKSCERVLTDEELHEFIGTL